MSELKGQLLGMLLVLTVFGVMAAILVPQFKNAATSVAQNIGVDSNGVVQTASAKAAPMGVIEFRINPVF